MAKQIKNSLGQHFFNKGEETQIVEDRFVIDKSKTFYLFDVIPMGAPRMTRADKWKKREVVLRYFAMKNILQLQANLMKYEMGETLNVVFFLPMPDTWSNKKKEAMNGLPHKQKPDTDNLVKGIKDSLLKDDSVVWKEQAEKRWAFKGSILIYK
jgi:Holliday junction resolvase RusA-like endonuclease